ncbi:factor VIII intron 22 protein isoform X2 [Cimex lectularius]|uniref:Factor VIII intron 22 protein n=1 Tax=Cimex lectularius TaxID=79782 RepID=A0A8I6TBM9_CIMLE|nr:factor VIII intron 22 protein isoform X2 [Cimex lectularius]
MSVRTPSDFLTQYKSISNKLKKKFLRKPNASEPSDQFASLAAQCERFDLPQYAALSWLAVAKCESSLEHPNEEATALVKAGRLFLQADSRNIIGCDEHLQGAVSCLRQAEKLWGPDNALSVSLCLEMGETLRKSSPHIAIMYLSRACDLLQHSPPMLLNAQGKLASVKISAGDYHGALSVFTDMVGTVQKITLSPFGVYTDVLVRCEISRVLLILLLRPTPQTISPELAKLVEKYTWVSAPDQKTKSLLSEELFFLLQSLVMACQCQELDAIIELESDLWKYFCNEQKELLECIVEEMNNSEK